MSFETDSTPVAVDTTSIEGACTIIAGWLAMCLNKENQAKTNRHYLVLTIIGFGALVCSILSAKNNVMIGFLFLVLTYWISLFLNSALQREQRAWANSRSEVENLSRLVAMHADKVFSRLNFDDFLTPSQLFEEFRNEYQGGPSDAFSQSIYYLGFAVLLCAAIVIAHDFGFYVDIGRDLSKP